MGLTHVMNSQMDCSTDIFATYKALPLNLNVKQN